MNSKNYLIIVGFQLSYILYLISDIMHYFEFRHMGLYPDYVEFPYESHMISYIKWGICFVNVLSFYLINKGSKVGVYIVYSTSLIVILISIFKGQIQNSMIGSVTFQFLLLEITAVLALVYIIVVSKKDLTLIKIGASTFLACALYFLFISRLYPFVDFPG